ncbi:MAG: hypothetical protein ABMA64_14560, partial [Myxococcota bacterium]
MLAHRCHRSVPHADGLGRGDHPELAAPRQQRAEPSGLPRATTGWRSPPRITSGRRWPAFATWTS